MNNILMSVVEYYERADEDKINRLLASDELNNMEKEQIYAYRKKINGNGYVKVNYKHAKGVLNVGRYFWKVHYHPII